MMEAVHTCKSCEAKGQPHSYTVCVCGHQYCSHTWSSCPRSTWENHPKVVAMEPIPTKAERAAKMFAFITEHATAGKTVYLQTALRITTLRKKHLPQVRVRNDSLEIQCGKRWIDYTYVDKVTAR